MAEETLQALEAVLHELNVPDNARIEAAEGRLASLKKASRAALLPELLRLVAGARSEEARHMAAVLAAKNATGRWRRLPVEARHEVKHAVLALLPEPATSLPVRTSLASLVRAIARHELPANTWPELFGFVQQCAASAAPEHRRLGMFVLQSVLSEPITVERLAHMHASLLSLIGKMLQDDDAISACLAVQCLSSVIGQVEEENAGLVRGLVAPSLVAIRRCIDVDETVACDAMDILEECTESELGLLKVLVTDLCMFGLQIDAHDPPLVNEARMKAWSFIHHLVNSRPKTLVKKKLLVPILQQIAHCLERDSEVFTEADAADAEEAAASGSAPVLDHDDDDDHAAVYLYATHVLAAIAVSVPPVLVLPAISSFVGAHASSPASGHRKASMDAIRAIVEGCAHHIRSSELLLQLLTFVAAGMRDDSARVRMASCFALSELAEHCQPEISAHHAELLPAILAGARDSHSEVRDRCCFALECFLDNMEDSVVPYIGPVYEVLEHLTTQGDDPHLLALSCIGALATAAKEHFAPLVDSVAAHLKQLMRIRHLDQLPLLCQAIDTMGLLATSTQTTVASAHAHEAVNLALQAVQEVDDPDVRIAAYTLFGSYARLLEEEFAPLLDDVVPALLQSCRASAIQHTEAHSRAAAAAAADEDSYEDGAEADDDDDDGDEFTINTSELPEAEAALQLLGALAKFCAASFARFLGPTLEACRACMDDRIQWSQVGIRKATVRTLGLVAEAAFRFTNGAEGDEAAAWTPGLPVGYPVEDTARQIIHHVIGLELQLLQKETDKRVVCEALDTLEDMINTVGPVALEPEGAVPVFSEFILAVLTQRSPSQRENEEEGDLEEEEEEELAEMETLVLEFAGDCLVALAKAIGPEYAALCGPMALQFVAMYQRPDPPVHLRSMVIGHFGELYEALGASLQELEEPLMRCLLSALGDEEVEVRGNALYATGLAYVHGSDRVDAYVPAMLAALDGNLQLSVEESDMGHVIDNACGCAGRVLQRYVKGPLDETAKQSFAHLVARVAARLPLLYDLNENVPVYTSLATVAAHQPELVLPHLAQVVNGAASAVYASTGASPEGAAQTKLAAEIRAAVHSLLQQLSRIASDGTAAAIAALPDELRQYLPSA